MYNIYLITNTINNKKYIGITSKSIKTRYKEHLDAAFKKDHKNILYNALRKYGKDAFLLELVEKNIPFELGEEKEIYYIKKYNSYYQNGEGYNMTIGGNGTVGYKITQAARDKISEAGKGRVFTKERNQKISNAKKGIKFSKEWKQNISKSRKGRFQKEDNPFFGKHHSDETKQIIGEKNRGLVRSESFKKHQSDIRKGKKFTEEHKKRLSQNNGASQKVLQLSLEGTFIKKYISCNEAERQTGVKAWNIRACGQGKQKTAGGFIWEYIE